MGSQAAVEVVDQDFIEQYREMGADEFHVWTIDDPAIAQKYRKMGAWGITTNRPAWLKKELQPSKLNCCASVPCPELGLVLKIKEISRSVC